MGKDNLKVALVSVHGCPLARLGERDTGGMNVYLLQLAKELGSQGVSADVFTRYHDPNDPQIVDLGPGARVIHIKAGGWYEPKDGIHQLLPEFVSNMLQFKEDASLEYDLYHSHYWLSGEAVSLLNRQTSLPHIASFHTLGEAKLRARTGEEESNLRINSEKLILTEADKILAVSQHERSNMIDYYYASGDKISVIPCGVDMDNFRPMDKGIARRELGITSGKILLFVGRVQPLKGPELLLHALHQLGPNDDLKLLIVGGDKEGDEDMQRVQELAGDLGISDRVSFEGIVPQDRLVLYYNAADLCLVPSYYESFGMVATEAMACGTPVVAAAVGGLLETVKNGVNGCLINSRSPKVFAEKIAGLLNDSNLRSAMETGARASVTNLDWPIIASKVAGLYQSVAGSHN